MHKNSLKITRPGGPIDVEGLWAPNPALLICGGPSLKNHDLGRLREKGVVSLGVNLCSAVVPVRAWVYSDGHEKFHPNLFLDPAVMTFAPAAHFGKTITGWDGENWRSTKVTVADCPSTYGYHRQTMFVPHRFFEDDFCHWGPGRAQPPREPRIGKLVTAIIGIRLLHHLGVRRIYLVGMDHQGDGQKCYGFPNSKGHKRPVRFQCERWMLESLDPWFAREGLEIYNTSEGSSLDLYPTVSFDAALRDCKGGVPEESTVDTTHWYEKTQIKNAREAGAPMKVPHHG